MPRWSRWRLFPLIFLALGSGAGAGEDVCVREGYRCADLVYRGFTYPYPRQEGSWLYINSGIYPYVEATENLLGDSTVRLPDGSVVTVDKLLQSLELGHMADARLTPVIGYGSNPAPSQIARKFALRSYDGDVVVPVMKGVLHDFDVVWTPVFVSYGSMPATVTVSEGTDVDVWVTWLDSAAEQTMNATEHSNPDDRPLYIQSTLENARYSFDGPEPDRMKIYISCFGPLTIDGTTYAVGPVPAAGRTFAPISSPEAMARIIPLLDWKGSIAELLYSNVISPEDRARRSTVLEPYGSFPDIPDASGLEACLPSREGPEKAY